MKYYVYILLFWAICLTEVFAQQPPVDKGKRGGFSLSSLSSSQKEIPDSLLVTDSTEIKSKRIKAYNLTPLLGEAYQVQMDTSRLNFSNSSLVEGYSVAVGYLANLGSPAQTRIFNERKEARDFIFADPYTYYITTPTNARFYDTKIPYTNITYLTAGSDVNKEERLKGTLTLNFGKKINVGGDFDYIYSHGYYNSNGDKLLSYRFFGSYLTDRYELHAYLSNFNFINYENGGLTNDLYITNPDDFSDGKRVTDTKAFPVRMVDTWNRVRGKQYFFTHRYNLGFYKTLEETDEEGNPKEVFVPVSSIIHTFDYEDNRRRFVSKMPSIDTCYTNVYNYNYPSDNRTADDGTSTWKLSNTFGLSLREGFQDWAKFGLTAFINLEKRRFRLPAETAGMNGIDPINPPSLSSGGKIYETYDEFSTYIGAELSKRKGDILTYNARGELCLIGDDIGEFRASGELKSQFSLFKKDASVRAFGEIKNVTPAFYERHNHSRFFWWDLNLRKTQHISAGAEVNLESTKTKLSANVESIQNYVLFNTRGLPEQYDGNIQVLSARIKQDFRVKALGWENEIVYQLTSKKEVLPLPQISLYTNLYLAFKMAKVLTLQIGADMHYNTAYYAPYYEPATQQFQVQQDVKVGNFPLINAYANFHLKQARFFIMFYNLGSKFVDPNYFSLAHYPLNPMIMKMGIAVTFNN